MRVAGDGIEVDLFGSADQTPTAYNVPFEGSTKVAAFAAFRKLLLDAATSEARVPSNEGSFRPIKVIAPEGSIFNPRFPASAEARFTQCNRMIDLIIKAMAPVLPETVIAGSSASISFAAYSGVRLSGDYWVFLEVNEGAYGGRPPTAPTASTISCRTRATTRSRTSPCTSRCCAGATSSGTTSCRVAGRFRGGVGVVKAQRMLTPGFITHESERHYDVPWGIFGGHEGAVGRTVIYNVNDATAVRVLRPRRRGRRRDGLLQSLRRRIRQPARAGT